MLKLKDYAIRITVGDLIKKDIDCKIDLTVLFFTVNSAISGSTMFYFDVQDELKAHLNEKVNNSKAPLGENELLEIAYIRLFETLELIVLDELERRGLEGLIDISHNPKEPYFTVETNNNWTSFNFKIQEFSVCDWEDFLFYLNNKM